MAVEKLADLDHPQTDMGDVLHVTKRLSLFLVVLWPLTLRAALGPVADQPTPVINEFMASNAAAPPLSGGEILDTDGDSSDWIELYNPAAIAFDLGGWYLTDDRDDLGKWRFPSRTIRVDSPYTN